MARGAREDPPRARPLTAKPVRLDPGARLEAAEAAHWYEGRRPGQGGTFLDAVATGLEELEARAPDTFPPAPCAPTAEVTFRFARVRGFPYRPIFAERADELRVYAVAHLRRRPAYWRDRLERP